MTNKITTLLEINQDIQKQYHQLTDRNILRIWPGFEQSISGFNHSFIYNKKALLKKGGLQIQKDAHN